jgi:tetratricopeptide (TPR) repeat protein
MEDAFIKAVQDAGGKITGDRRLLNVSFDDDSPGFWLDMLILIETVTKTMETAAADLYGYSLVLGRNLAETSQALEPLCRFFAGGIRGGGVFLDTMAAEKLLPYITVEEPEQWLETLGKGAEAAGTSRNWRSRAESFFRFDGIKVFIPTVKTGFFQWENILQTFRQEPQYSTLVIGPCFEKKQDDLFQCCASIAGNFPPLPIRFGTGTLTALIDTWSPRLYSPSDAAEEISELWEFLFRERLREEISGFIARKTSRFFRLLLNFYTTAARQANAVPIIILENIHLAEKIAVDIFIDSLTVIQKTQSLAILGTCSEQISDDQLKKWSTVFSRQYKINALDIPGSRPLELQGALPTDLWEISYAISLFGRYYPPFLFLRLFEEAGRNTVMISRALSFLVSLGVIDTPLDPRPWPENFCKQAEAVLGPRAEPVRKLVRDRLLAWVEQKKINPCFRLLLILADLGGIVALEDNLILKSIAADMVNGTTAGLEYARDIGVLEALAGTERAAAIRYILESTTALLSGNENEIRTAFRDPPPDYDMLPVLKGRILVNLSSLHLGQRNIDAALESIKEVILLGQGESNLSLAQAYRLFSLVSLSKKRTREAVDYLGFAVDHAERTGNYHEMGVSAYYSATVQFLTGNISGAIQLIRKAREQALAAACPEWADRSYFLEGRFAFETGQYKTALDIFVNIRNAPLGELSARKEQLLDAWAYRTRVYFQNPLSPKPLSGGYDADLFEVEAAYLAGNYQKAVELSSVLANPHMEENFLFTEQPDWRSGFSLCEYLYFSNGEIWDRMLSMYHSLALCHISPSGGEEALHNMQRILRDEKMSEMDPWDAVYFYAWYRILEQTGAGQVDMNTALTLAFKRLQRRASRIDDMETRRQFLSQPHWNRALNLAAKEFKSI